MGTARQGGAGVRACARSHGGGRRGPPPDAAASATGRAEPSRAPRASWRLRLIAPCDEPALVAPQGRRSKCRGNAFHGRPPSGAPPAEGSLLPPLQLLLLLLLLAVDPHRTLGAAWPGSDLRWRARWGQTGRLGLAAAAAAVAGAGGLRAKTAPAAVAHPAWHCVVRGPRGRRSGAAAGTRPDRGPPMAGWVC